MQLHLIRLDHLAKTYGRPPSTWLLTPTQRSTPEGQAFAFDLDSAAFALSRDWDRRQREYAEQDAENLALLGLS